MQYTVRSLGRSWRFNVSKYFANGSEIHSLCDDTRCADTLSSLGDQEHTLFLDRLVDVVSFVRAIRDVIVCDVIDLVLLQEVYCDHPWTVFNDLIHPFAVPDGLCSFFSAQHSKTFSAMGFLVTRDAHKKVGVWERGLCLFELAHMATKVSPLVLTIGWKRMTNPR